MRCNGEYPLTDGRVNVRLTTNASQQVTSSNQPDAFGISSVTAGTASAYAYGGAVGYREDGIAPAGLSSVYGFQKVGARYYDPTFGAFLTRDTDLSQSPYAYCNGDPVNESDPSGHESGPTDDAGVGGIFGGAILAGGVFATGATMEGGFLVALATAGPTGGLSLALYVAAAVIIAGVAIIVHNHPPKPGPPLLNAPPRGFVPKNPFTGRPLGISLNYFDPQGLIGVNNFNQDFNQPSKSGKDPRNY